MGGNALVQFGTELALPVPFKGDWTRQVRPVIFAEGAQVFDTQCDVLGICLRMQRCVAIL